MEDQTPKKRFSQIIHELGDLDFDAAQRLESVVRACTETGKKGKLTLELSIEPRGNAKHIILPKVTPKAPQPAPSPSIFYSDDQGTLLQDHPDQMKFNFQDKNTPTD